MRRPCLLVAGLLLLPQQLASRMEAPPRPLPLPRLPVEESLRVLRGTIARNSTLEAALSGALSPTVIHHLVATARPLYNLARISVGHPFDLTLGPNGVLAAFSYGIDELRTLRVLRNGDGLEAQLVTRSYDVRTEAAAGIIRTSLFAAVERAGEEDQLALDLADIFAWDVDFNTELQPGDSFRAAVEKMYLDGRFVRYGRVVSAELVRGDRTLQAVRFEGHRGPEYYTPNGVPLRKTLLRSPLKFSRISSGFSRARFHPILRRVRPHLGVDYAAPSGTPVMAAGDGLVVRAGWWGGYGRVVRLRHVRGIETLYGHLSRIAVRAGQRVLQGDVIGNVGTTGLSTAPHLDYRTIRDGVYVNPRTIQPPPPEPVPAASRAAFEAVRDQALALLDSAPVVVRQASLVR